MVESLRDAEWDRDQVGEDRGNETVVEGDRHLLDDEVPDRNEVPLRLAEIESGEVAEVETVAPWLEVEAIAETYPREDGPIEPVVLPQDLQLLRRNRRPRDGRTASTRNLAATTRTRHLKPDLIDRAAWDELTEYENDEGDPEERRDHEQESTDDVGAKSARA